MHLQLYYQRQTNSQHIDHALTFSCLTCTLTILQNRTGVTVATLYLEYKRG